MNRMLRGAIAILAVLGISGSSFAEDAPFAVGNTTLFLHDETRPFDRVGGVEEGVRTLITEIWYPVDHAVADRYPRATYGDYVFGNRAMHRRMLTKTTFFHLTPDSVRDGVSAEQIDAAIDELYSRKRLSYRDAPLAHHNAPFPVVVFSHGDAGSRYNMDTVTEMLAAQGYVVIAPEHTGNTPFALIGHDPALDAETGDPNLRAKMAPVLEQLDAHGAYGTDEMYGQSSFAPNGTFVERLRWVDDSLVERVNDLRIALAELDARNANGPWKGRLDLGGVGVVGRSFGGATTLAALLLDDRFAAGIAVVPPALPDFRPKLPDDALTEDESASLATRDRAVVGTLSKPTLLLSCREDKLIIDLARQVGLFASPPRLPTVENPHPVWRDSFEAASVPVIWGLLDATNHASFGVSSVSWWPELKPDTAPRALAPDESFTLYDVDKAHAIQAEKTLQFFDFFIRGDASVRDALLENPDEEHLAWEARNIP